MTQTLLDLSAPPERPPNMTELVAAYFKARPHQRVSPFELMALGCHLCWRTEISRCRLEMGMRITPEYEQTGRKKRSFYVYTPEAQ